jgi:6-phosphofructokinase 1
VDLGRKVINEVTLRLERRGIKVSMVDKTIGYELRCAPPLPMEAEYARDLGYAAVRNLVAGGPSAVITRENGAPRAIALGDCVDPATGKGLRRAVDVRGYDYRVARRYMVRLEQSDFADAEWVGELAAAGGMTPQQLRDHFARLSGCSDRRAG